MIKRKRRIGLVLLGLGLLSMIIGISKGEIQIVEQKSNIICFECIGID